MGRPPNPIDPNGSFAEHYGWKIRTLREERGWSLEELATKLVCSVSHLSRLERALKAPDKQIARLLDAALDTTYFTEHWLLAVRDRLSSSARSLAEHEAEARVVRAYMPTLVVGPFQTEDYARAIVKAGAYRANVDVIVAERMRRQAVLGRENGPRIQAVMDETALRRRIGGPDVLRAQLERLLEEMIRPNVTIQVVPADVGEYPGLPGGFELLSPAEGSDVAYVEGTTGMGRMVQEPAAISAMHETYDLIRAVALPVNITAQVIKEIRDTL
ncbi:Helix-turn-helix [Thermomonospora echinospora]|uniref:Helix-turn-helix n=1 Tax=Thermomonospora echinospora TaxID=1992 RepID=A0A1H5VGX3_9ACTN|nr:helix-turn-helix transcriptional regulator [Thermomonospora echinospora]SEF86615.1 Helix-turn-helix [Thermomonospora echinospora]